jgi:hypothetical protein
VNPNPVAVSSSSPATGRALIKVSAATTTARGARLGDAQQAKGLRDTP